MTLKKKTILLIVATVFIALGITLAATCNHSFNAQTTTIPQDAPHLKVGLVLGGGGAKGAAHVGALKAIEKAGIPVDYIAGTSIGAIVGGLYACGYSADQIDSLFRSQEWLDLLTDRRTELNTTAFRNEGGTTYIFGIPLSASTLNLNQSFDQFFGNGIVAGDSIVNLLRRLTTKKGVETFQQTRIPFRCVATEFQGINPKNEVVLHSGDLAMAMRASMAIPAYFKAVKIGKKTLLDGGVMNNLPVDVVKAMGADIVIAVDLTQNTPDDPTLKLSQSLGLGEALDWVLSRPDITKYKQNLKDVDLYIRPNLNGYEAYSFTEKSIEAMIDSGTIAGKKKEFALKRLKLRIYTLN